MAGILPLKRFRETSEATEAGSTWEGQPTCGQAIVEVARPAPADPSCRAY